MKVGRHPLFGVKHNTMVLGSGQLRFHVLGIYENEGAHREMQAANS